jgi:hypothetical protein
MTEQNAGRLMQIHIRLAEVPKFAWEEYHPEQASRYIQLTEYVFKALHLPSIREFLERLAEDIEIEEVEVRVCRLPSRSSMVYITENGGKQKLVIKDHRGRVPKKGGFIDIYPPPMPFQKGEKPKWLLPFCDTIVLLELKSLIHEMLHLGLKEEEKKIEQLTDQQYQKFLQKYQDRFNKELAPLLEEWRKATKSCREESP